MKQNGALMKRRSFLALPVAAAVAAVAALAACGKKKDPVQSVLDGVVAAAEKGDASDLMAFVAEDFKAANGESRADAELSTKRYLMAYDGLKVTLRDVKVDKGGAGEAFVTFRADIAGTPKNIGGLAAYLPSSGSYRFELRLVESDGRMKIAWASWQGVE